MKSPKARRKRREGLHPGNRREGQGRGRQSCGHLRRRHQEDHLYQELSPRRNPSKGTTQALIHGLPVVCRRGGFIPPSFFFCHPEPRAATLSRATYPLWAQLLPLFLTYTQKNPCPTLCIQRRA